MNKDDNLANNVSAAALLYSPDIARLKKFYIETLGFDVRSEPDADRVLYFESTPALELQTATSRFKKVRIRIELPNRRELAKVIGRLCTVNQTNTRIETEDRQLTRLRDPDGNEVEFFVLKEINDRTLEKPLDIEALFNELQPDDRLCDKLPASARLVIEEV